MAIAWIKCSPKIVRQHFLILLLSFVCIENIARAMNFQEYGNMKKHEFHNTR